MWTDSIHGVITILNYPRTYMDKKILTHHPDRNKNGNKISKKKYDIIRACILTCLEAQPLLSYTDMANCVRESLQDKFEGSINWYVEVVKLDLEAKHIIKRVSETRPQLYKLTS
jgi:hypothetical protein